MALTIKGKGIDSILRNLHKEIQKIEGDTQKGLTLLGTVIKGDSMRDTPVDTGNLKGSHYLVSGNGKVDQGSGKFDTRDSSGRKVAAEHSGHVSEAASNAQSKDKPFIELGCTAHYAEKVHEDLEVSHVKPLYTDKKFVGPVPVGPVGKAKFLEDAVKKHAVDAPTFIQRFAKR